MKRRRSSKNSRKRNQTVLHTAIKSRRQSKKIQKMAAMSVGLVLLTGISAFGVQWLSQKLMEKVFFENEDFALETIEISNPGGLNRAEILNWAGVQRGENLIEMNLTAVHYRLSQMPYIAGVQVERKLPSTLRIVINERLPVAKLMPFSPKGNLLAQTVYYIDSGGFVMKPKEGEKLKLLPLITGISIDEVRAGEFIEKEEVLSALNLLRASTHYGLGGALDLRRLEIQDLGIISVRTRERGLIRFRSDHLDEQIKRLQLILAYTQRNHKYIRTVDLTPERNVPVTFF